MPRSWISLINLLPLLLLLCLLATKQTRATTIEEGAAWLEEYDSQVREVYSGSMEASWTYYTNLTQYNQNQSVAWSLKLSEFTKEAADNASKFDWRDYPEGETKRLFSKMAILGTSGLDTADLEKVVTLGADMRQIYSTAKVCGKPEEDPDNCYPLDPDLTQVMATSRDWDVLKWAWQGWREKTGRLMPDMYEEFVTLNNKAAVKDKFEDTGDYWRSWYEMEDFEDKVERLWQQVEPLYKQLHTYIRKKLKEEFSDYTFPSDGRIPAHLLGNMWSQTWDNIASLVLPYPEIAPLDVTTNLVNQGYNATEMFRVAEEFFVSLGMDQLPQLFWEKSMLVKPDDGREVVCHASAWDFRTGDDFRVKMCTDITGEDLDTVHHELGHIYYYLEYKDQPFLFQRGANPGFHEAVGDVISLSVTTPGHLHKIGLLDQLPSQAELDKADLNYLMTQALQKIAFLPFGFLMDQWRWGVFSGDTTKQQYNDKWWELRCRYQGIAPPVDRVSSDFDPGAKYHIPANVPYVRYFVSFILQFQFHDALCKAAGHNGTLHSCDIYKSTEAGQSLREMLKLGSSKPWPEALQPLTGGRVMDAQALMDYFEPLITWLEEQNSDEPLGWTCGNPTGWELNNVETTAWTSGQPVLKHSAAIFLVVILMVLFR